MTDIEQYKKIARDYIGQAFNAHQPARAPPSAITRLRKDSRAL